MDGLAATLAAIAFGFFAIDAVTVHPNTLVLAFALAGAFACVGFLPFNLRPRGRALVFMGDSGSLAIGFALAALGLAASWRVAGTTVATLVLPILILAVPILDTALVTVVRLLEGRPIYQGGRDHSSHRLVRFGLSERHAVALLALIATGIGASSLAYNVLDNVRYTIVGVVITFALLVQFASFLADVERRPPPEGEAARPHAGVRRPLAARRRGARRLRRDHRLLRGRLRDRVRLARHDEPAVHRRTDAAGRPRRPLPRPSSRSASTGRSGATPARATPRRSPPRSSSPR